MGLPAVTSLVLLMLSASFSAGLPEELMHLEGLASKPGELVDASRRFDKQQQRLIEWDRELIQEYLLEGKQDLAATKRDDIRHRVDLMRMTWVYVTDRYPNNARALNYYGEFLYDYGQNQAKAVQNWRVAIRLDDKLAGAHNNIGIHFFHTGDYKNGMTHLQRALDLEDDNPDFLFNMAQMYLIYFPQLGKMLDLSKEKLYREAMRMSKKAAGLSPDDYDVLLDYATNFYAGANFGIEADWEAAAIAWQDARAQAHTDIQKFYTYLNEGRTWIRSGKLENAVGPLEAAAAMRSDSQVVEQLLVKARQGTG